MRDSIFTCTDRKPDCEIVFPNIWGHLSKAQWIYDRWKTIWFFAGGSLGDSFYIWFKA